MMLTTKGRYAVMAMVDLAYYKQNDKAIALHEIAQRQNIALNYLEQIFNKLKKSNLVVSLKGPGGGYFLNLPAKEVTILAIINAVEEPIKITRCSKDQLGCLTMNNKICFTHALWEGLSNNIEEYLRSLSLADVCSKVRAK